MPYWNTIISEPQNKSKIPTLSDILQTLSGLCHFMSSILSPNKGKQGYWLETIGSECPLYLGHTKCQEKNKGVSRNVSFYIKFSVLEVGHATSKKANWDMQQSKVFVDVSLSNYKKLWKTLLWHLCKKSNSFTFLKIQFLISRNSITFVSDSCRGYDLMLLFPHISILEIRNE